MVFELLVLVGLIIIFIASFCGLLQKVRESYENERRRLEAVHQRGSFTEIYINPNFRPSEINNDNNGDGVFPSTPPPYSDLYGDPPPKYEDIFKQLDILPRQLQQQQHPQQQQQND